MRLAWVIAVAACHFDGAQPPPPTCTAAAEHVASLLEHSSRAIPTRDVFAKRCDADGWSAEVRECVVATRSLRRPRHCKAKLSPRQRSALDLDLAAIASAAQAPITSMPTCELYRAQMSRLDACPSLAPRTRAALQFGYRQISEELARSYGSPALELQCKTMLEVLRQTISPVCGW